jgi:Sec7-like guanine-nucleotide exchange factor
LRQTPELSKGALGECIGAPANKAVLKAYCDQLDVSGMRYDEALRSFLSNFRLPGEAQIIDRIVQTFAVRYCDQNPGIFPNTDLAYTLVFAMIMLNTSLHNPRVDRKMTQEDFIYNFRNADEDAVLPDKLLEAMYKSIKEEKLEMGVDEQDQSGRIAFVSFFLFLLSFITKIII